MVFRFSYSAASLLRVSSIYSYYWYSAWNTEDVDEEEVDGRRGG
jgi:hypothetical protein